MCVNDEVIHSDPEIMGGVPVFIGTRVPARTLFDYLKAGDSLDEFLDDFPSVTREQAVAALANNPEVEAPTEFRKADSPQRHKEHKGCTKGD